MTGRSQVRLGGYQLLVWVGFSRLFIFARSTGIVQAIPPMRQDVPSVLIPMGSRIHNLRMCPSNLTKSYPGWEEFPPHLTVQARHTRVIKTDRQETRGNALFKYSAMKGPMCSGSVCVSLQHGSLLLKVDPGAECSDYSSFQSNFLLLIFNVVPMSLVGQAGVRDAYWKVRAFAAW